MLVQNIFTETYSPKRIETMKSLWVEESKILALNECWVTTQLELMVNLNHS